MPIKIFLGRTFCYEVWHQSSQKTGTLTTRQADLSPSVITNLAVMHYEHMDFGLESNWKCPLLSLHKQNIDMIDAMFWIHGLSEDNCITTRDMSETTFCDALALRAKVTEDTEKSLILEQLTSLSKFHFLWKIVGFEKIYLVRSSKTKGRSYMKVPVLSQMRRKLLHAQSQLSAYSLGREIICFSGTCILR